LPGEGGRERGGGRTRQGENREIRAGERKIEREGEGEKNNIVNV
jgi:hypothetical protein